MGTPAGARWCLVEERVDRYGMRQSMGRLELFKAGELSLSGMMKDGRIKKLPELYYQAGQEGP